MGIKKLLKELPGGKMSEQRDGFDTLADAFGVALFDARVDAGSVLHVCAVRHLVPFNHGDYAPAAREFKKLLMYFET